MSLPSVLSELVSEYKGESFRLSGENIVLNWVTKVKYPVDIDEVKSIPLALKKGVWHYTMSPFVRRYVNFTGSGEGVNVGVYSLARCYTLLFHHSAFNLDNLPSDLPANFSPQKKISFVTALTLCTEKGVPLFNTAFSTSPGGLDTVVVPSSDLYRGADGDYFLIPIAEVSPHDEILPLLLEETMDKKLGKEIGKLIKGDLGGAHTYAFPMFEEFSIKAKEAERVGLPTLGQKEIALFGGYDEDTGTRMNFAIRKDSDYDLDEKEYPILQKLAAVLSRFHMKNLRYDKAFDAKYRKRLIENEKEGGDRFYNDNPMKGDNDDGDNDDGDEDDDSDNGDEEDDNDEKSSGPLFDGLIFAISGKLSQSQSDISKLIAINGGQLRSSVTKDTNIVIANMIGSSKTEKAVKDGKRVVAEKWLHDSVEAGKRLPYSEYSLT